MMLHLQVKKTTAFMFPSLRSVHQDGLEHCLELEELFQEGFWTSNILKQQA
jgi:hypothetical protein